MSDNFEDIIVNKFTEESAKDFQKKVYSRTMKDSEMPIVIYIDSYGGYLDSLNSMLETIEHVPNPIVTVCKGKAMSCGAALLAAGDHRFCGRNSRVMIHPGSSGAQGFIESLQNDVDESKRLNKQIMTLIAKRCGFSLKRFKEEMKERLINDDDEARDLYLPAEAAKVLGIVDFVGMPLIRPVVMYSIESSEERKYTHAEELDKLLSEEPIFKKKVKKTGKKKTKKKVKKTSKKKTKKKATKEKK